MILENVLQAIGDTPIVKFNHIGSSLKCDLYNPYQKIPIIHSSKINENKPKVIPNDAAK